MMADRGIKFFVLMLLGVIGDLTLSSANNNDKGLRFESEWKVKKVHLIFMNHLDVGYYTGSDFEPGYAVQVLNEYLNTYFERAAYISNTLIERGYTERFIYTTHPWLLSLFFDCPNITLIGIRLKCPGISAQNQVAKAIRAGHIAWHAGPMNLETDNLGARLFDYGLSIGQDLDLRFNVTRTHSTLSQRDVPGLTKAIIPVLLARGVKAISVGVNPGTAPPAVPSPFLWKFNETDTDGIIGFWDKGGYPLNPGPFPAKPVGLARDKCLEMPGQLDEALCFAFRTDNTGPPIVIEEVLQYYEILRKEFPGAELAASTFDQFVAVLEPLKGSLPVRTYEIADTWIQGMGSDPKKTAIYYAWERLWEKCLDEGRCSNKDPLIQAMLRFLIKLPEHTWGVHNFLDVTSWSNTDLAVARRHKPVFNLTQQSWVEQRQFLDFARQALQDHPLGDDFDRELKAMEASLPDLSDYTPVSHDTEFSCPGGVKVRFAPDGSLDRLYDPRNKVDWASPNSSLVQITYDTYTEADFVSMARQYNYEAGVGYDKPNVTQYGHPERKRWPLRMTQLYRRKGSDLCDFWTVTSTVDEQTRSKYGAPKAFYIHYVTKDSGVNVEVVMWDKVTTRLPESISVNFNPVPSTRLWTLYKMGQPIDPCHVVLNGTQYVHGVDQKVTLTGHQGHGLELRTLYSPLVFLGTTDHATSPFPVPLRPLTCDTLRSVAFNLYNNIWDTNFIFWYPYLTQDKSFKARFEINFL